MVYSPLLTRLINAFRNALPGVGPKSAQRMVFHLLSHDKEGAQHLLNTLDDALQTVDYCLTCRNLSETPQCGICTDTARDKQLLCVVESPADVVAIEQTVSFNGQYFVLMGHLSPIDGVGPEDIGMELLIQHFDQGEIKEVVLGTNSTVEGEATAHYIAQLAVARQIRASRLASGVPVGGELEYVGGSTLSQAITQRITMYHKDEA